MWQTLKNQLVYIFYDYRLATAGVFHVSKQCFMPLTNLQIQLKNLMCCQHSREESSELGDKHLLPSTGEVNHLPTAPDITADTCSLLLTAKTCLRHIYSTQGNSKYKQARTLQSQITPRGFAVDQM